MFKDVSRAHAALRRQLTATLHDDACPSAVKSLTVLLLSQGHHEQINDLASERGVAGSTACRLVSGLEEKGLARRVHGESDARSLRPELTDRGRALATVVALKCEQVEHAALANFNDDEKAILVRMLRRVLNNRAAN